jgi:DNA-binding NarL/FixJ family response regulator
VPSSDPDVAVVDIRMPPTHTDEGLRAAQAIREKYPRTGVLVLSQYVETTYAMELLSDSAEGVGYPREREVLELMAEGRSNKAIAERLVVTERAVEKHVTSIFGKLRLPADSDDHRRVLAVLAYLRGS